MKTDLSDTIHLIDERGTCTSLDEGRDEGRRRLADMTCEVLHVDGDELPRCKRRRVEQVSDVLQLQPSRQFKRLTDFVYEREEAKTPNKQQGILPRISKHLYQAKITPKGGNSTSEGDVIWQPGRSSKTSWVEQTNCLDERIRRMEWLQYTKDKTYVPGTRCSPPKWLPFEELPDNVSIFQVARDYNTSVTCIWQYLLSCEPNRSSAFSSSRQEPKERSRRLATLKACHKEFRDRNAADLLFLSRDDSTESDSNKVCFPPLSPSASEPDSDYNDSDNNDDEDEAKHSQLGYSVQEMTDKSISTESIVHCQNQVAETVSTNRLPVTHVENYSIMNAAARLRQPFQNPLISKCTPGGVSYQKQSQHLHGPLFRNVPVTNSVRALDCTPYQQALNSIHTNSVAQPTLAVGIAKSTLTNPVYPTNGNSWPAVRTGLPAHSAIPPFSQPLGPLGVSIIRTNNVAQPVHMTAVNKATLRNLVHPVNQSATGMDGRQAYAAVPLSQPAEILEKPHFGAQQIQNPDPCAASTDPAPELVKATSKTDADGSDKPETKILESRKSLGPSSSTAAAAVSIKPALCDQYEPHSNGNQVSLAKAADPTNFETNVPHSENLASQTKIEVQNTKQQLIIPVPKPGLVPNIFSLHFPVEEEGLLLSVGINKVSGNPKVAAFRRTKNDKMGPAEKSGFVKIDDEIIGINADFSPFGDVNELRLRLKAESAGRHRVSITFLRWVTLKQLTTNLID